MVKKKKKTKELKKKVSKPTKPLWPKKNDNEKYLLCYLGNEDHIQIGNWILPKNEYKEMHDSNAFPLSYENTLKLNIQVLKVNK